MKNKELDNYVVHDEYYKMIAFSTFIDGKMYKLYRLDYEENKELLDEKYFGCFCVSIENYKKEKREYLGRLKEIDLDQVDTILWRHKNTISDSILELFLIKDHISLEDFIEHMEKYHGEYWKCLNLYLNIVAPNILKSTLDKLNSIRHRILRQYISINPTYWNKESSKFSRELFRELYNVKELGSNAIRDFYKNIVKESVGLENEAHFTKVPNNRLIRNICSEGFDLLGLCLKLITNPGSTDFYVYLNTKNLKFEDKEKLADLVSEFVNIKFKNMKWNEDDRVKAEMDYEDFKFRLKRNILSDTGHYFSSLGYDYYVYDSSDSFRDNLIRNNYRTQDGECISEEKLLREILLGFGDSLKDEKVLDILLKIKEIIINNN